MTVAFVPTGSRILDVLNSATGSLQRSGVENARLNAERLLARTLGLGRAQLYLHGNDSLSDSQISILQALLQRRSANEPLQYLLGETEFMSLPFKVTPDVLIPRPETEILVEETIALCDARIQENRVISVLDLGTGSGCVAVSLAKSVDSVQVVALDISQAALQVAAENAALNHVADKIKFAYQDFFNTDMIKQFPDPFDIIVSNPPYVSHEEFQVLAPEIRDFEPKVALNDGADGLSCYRRISELVPRLLKATGALAMEVGLGQAPAVERMFATQGFGEIKSCEDLNGIARVVICEHKPTQFMEESND